MTIEALRQMKLSAEQAETEKGRKLAKLIADAMEKGLAGGVLKESVDEGTLINRHPEITLNRDVKTIVGQDGIQERLSPKEEEMLNLFLSNVGRVVPVADVYQNVSTWETYGAGGLGSPLGSVLSKLREKLRAIGASNEDFPEGYLLTIRKFGLVLVDPKKPEQVAKYKGFTHVKK